MAATSSSQSNALTLSKGTLFSRILGFARDIAVAALIGGGWMSDALLLAFRIPSMARALLAEGAFAYTLVPAYRKRMEEGRAQAGTFIRSMTLALFCTLGSFSLLGTLFSSQLVRLLAPGLKNMPDILAMASGFMRLCLPSLPLIAGAAVCSAVLMAEGQFRRPAYSSALFNAVIILFAGAAFMLYGPGEDSTPYVLCVGIIAAGSVQWAYQAAPLARFGFSWAGPVRVRDGFLLQSLRTLPGSMFSVGGHMLNIFIATVFASFLAEGSISALYYAERLIGFPVGIIGTSMGLAALSDLSRLVSSHEPGKSTNRGPSEFTVRLGNALRITLFFVLPAAVGTACLAMPLTSTIFGYGEFGQEALERTSSVLLALIVGLPPLAAIRPLLAGLGALGDTESPMRAALSGIGATVAFGLLLLFSDAPWGPALAVSLAAWINAGMLLRALKLCGVLPLPGMSWGLRVLAACGIMAACVIWASGLFDSNPGKVATIPLGVAAYFAAAFLLRLEETALARPILNKLLRMMGRELTE